MPNERALAVLGKAILYGFTLDGDKRPGAIIERMSPDDRELLKKLTSADTMQQRSD